MTTADDYWLGKGRQAACAALTGLALWGGPLPAFLLLGLLCASLPAQRSLHDHVLAVETALRTGGVEAGRRAVAMIVGRDPDTLDAPAVCRAAIESLAENFPTGSWRRPSGSAASACPAACSTRRSTLPTA